ncbi:STAS domain-containing protein [Pseudonocardia zijingensis]|jgi:anti-sigma B factor antagonist|uniref:Anti-sigma factor antagonist n=1 Tax=Pseudonocardia zijingensis TaxID=153376 RepID=A0ABN1N9K0_9PSEU
MGESGRPSPEFLDTTLSRPYPDTAVLAARGEVDSLTAPDFRAAIEELLEASERVLVIDLTEVRFLASSGLAALIAAAHAAEDRGIRLRLVISNRAVRRPLEITGTGELFDLHTDPVSACGGRD